MMRLLGLDPGLRHTGWGIVEAEGNRLRHVADGAVHGRNAKVAQCARPVFRLSRFDGRSKRERQGFGRRHAVERDHVARGRLERVR